MAEFPLSLTDEEHDFLVRILKTALHDTRIEEPPERYAASTRHSIEQGQLDTVARSRRCVEKRRQRNVLDRAWRGDVSQCGSCRVERPRTGLRVLRSEPRKGRGFAATIIVDVNQEPVPLADLAVRRGERRAEPEADRFPAQLHRTSPAASRTPYTRWSRAVPPSAAFSSAPLQRNTRRSGAAASGAAASGSRTHGRAKGSSANGAATRIAATTSTA